MTDEAQNTTTAGRPSLAKLVGIFAAVAFGLYVLFSVAHHGSAAHGSTSRGVPEGEAWNSCKQAVSAQLRNPDSADFALTSTDLSQEHNGAWSVAGTLKAVNDFNVQQEIAYSCRVTPAGAATAQLTH